MSELLKIIKEQVKVNKYSVTVPMPIWRLIKTILKKVKIGIS